MTTFALFLLFPFPVGMALAWLDATGPLRRFWAITTGVGLVAAGILVIWMSPFTESSPVTAVMWGLCPTLIAALVIRGLGHWKAWWGWKGMIGGVIAGAMILPTFMLSCIVAEFFPFVPGCFF